MKKVKIYSVEREYYADEYVTEALFSDRTQAEIFCATHQEFEGCFICEFELDEYKFDTNKKPKQIWEGLFRDDNLIDCTDENYTFDDILTVRKEDYNTYICMSFDTNIRKEEVAKIICDKYAQWKCGQIEIDYDDYDDDDEYI